MFLSALCFLSVCLSVCLLEELQQLWTYFHDIYIAVPIIVNLSDIVCVVFFEYIGLCYKYQIPNPYCSVSYIKHAMV